MLGAVGFPRPPLLLSSLWYVEYSGSHRTTASEGWGGGKPRVKDEIQDREPAPGKPESCSWYCILGKFLQA